MRSSSSKYVYTRRQGVEGKRTLFIAAKMSTFVLLMVLLLLLLPGLLLNSCSLCLETIHNDDDVPLVVGR